MNDADGNSKDSKDKETQKVFTGLMLSFTIGSLVLMLGLLLMGWLAVKNGWIPGMS